MTRPLLSFAVFRLRRPSLIRGNLLVLGSFAISFRISDFPRSRATLLLIIPAMLAIVGTLETFRCMHPQRDLYHGGVMLFLFMDMLVICLILFFLVFPYLI